MVLAYWGEAKTHYRPLWLGLDRPATRAVLSRLPDDSVSDPDSRASMYLAAMRRLAEPGDEDMSAPNFPKLVESPDHSRGQATP